MSSGLRYLNQSFRLFDKPIITQKTQKINIFGKIFPNLENPVIVLAMDLKREVKKASVPEKSVCKPGERIGMHQEI